MILTDRAIAARMRRLVAHGASATRQILGVDIALTDYEGELAAIDELIADAAAAATSATRRWASVMNARRDAAARAALNEATMTVPDGKPIVWALRSLGEEI